MNNVAVVRRLLAHAKTQGWKREPLDITEDGDHGVVYHNYTWRTPDLRRVCVGTARDSDHLGIPDWFVNTWGGNTNVGIEHVETARQVTELLAVIGLVPAERDDLRAEVATVNEALNNVSDLLDEARMQRDAAVDKFAVCDIRRQELEAHVASMQADRAALSEWLGRLTGLAPTDEDTCLSDWVIRVITERDAAAAAPGKPDGWTQQEWKRGYRIRNGPDGSSNGEVRSGFEGAMLNAVRPGVDGDTDGQP